MTTLLEERIYTPDDVLTLNGDMRYELIDGELVEKNMGAEASEIGAEIAGILRPFCKQNRLGRVLPEATFKCFPRHPGRVRSPDVAFIAKGKLPDDKLPKGHVTVLPDLVVEVNSPNDLADAVDAKVDDYLAAGVRQVWIASPQSRYVRIYRLNGPTSELRGSEIISGEDVIPGFSCPVSDFFQTV